ncbi:MAG: hypothetical protein AB1733_17090 [Thermodesulfobacteriota bacterium]
MRIPASESTAIKKVVECENKHKTEVWYIRTPDGLVIEAFGMPHTFLPKSRDDAAYKNGDCCFRAACEAAWAEGFYV